MFLLKFQHYLSGLGELEFITKEFLKNDYEFQLKLEEIPISSNIASEIDEHLYRKFNYKNFNNANFIPINTTTFTDKNATKNPFATRLKLNVSSLKNGKILVNKNNLTMKSIPKAKEPSTNTNTLPTNEDLKNDDGSISSFLNEDSNSSIECSTILSDSPLLSVYSLRMQKLKNKQKKIRFLNQKELNKDYNPKVLTTREC